MAETGDETVWVIHPTAVTPPRGFADVDPINLARDEEKDMRPLALRLAVDSFSRPPVPDIWARRQVLDTAEEYLAWLLTGERPANPS